MEWGAWRRHGVRLLSPLPSTFPLTPDPELPQGLPSLFLLGEVNPEALLGAQAAERGVRKPEAYQHLQGAGARGRSGERGWGTGTREGEAMDGEALANPTHSVRPLKPGLPHPGISLVPMACGLQRMETVVPPSVSPEDSEVARSHRQRAIKCGGLAAPTSAPHLTEASRTRGQEGRASTRLRALS